MSRPSVRLDAAFRLSVAADIRFKATRRAGGWRHATRESFSLISFHDSITRDERKIVFDCLPDEHPAKGRVYLCKTECA